MTAGGIGGPVGGHVHSTPLTTTPAIAQPATPAIIESKEVDQTFHKISPQEIDQNINALTSSAEQRETFIKEKLISETKHNLNHILGKAVDSLVDPKALPKIFKGSLLKELENKINDKELMGKIIENLDLKGKKLEDLTEEELEHAIMDLQKRILNSGNIQEKDKKFLKAVSELKTHDAAFKIERIKGYYAAQPKPLSKEDENVLKDINLLEDTLKKLSANLDELAKNPPTNFKAVVQGLFHNFQKELNEIYEVKQHSISGRIIRAFSNGQPAREHVHIVLSAALSELGEGMIHSYVENLKERTKDNKFLDTLNGNALYIKNELSKHFYEIAFPDADEHLLKEAGWEFAQAAILRVGTLIVAGIDLSGALPVHTGGGHHYTPATSQSGTHTASLSTGQPVAGQSVTPQLAQDLDIRNGIMFALSVPEVIPSMLGTEATIKDPLRQEVARLKQRIVDVKETIKKTTDPVLIKHLQEDILETNEEILKLEETALMFQPSENERRKIDLKKHIGDIKTLLAKDKEGSQHAELTYEHKNQLQSELLFHEAELMDLNEKDMQIAQSKGSLTISDTASNDPLMERAAVIKKRIKAIRDELKEGKLTKTQVTERQHELIKLSEEITGKINAANKFSKATVHLLALSALVKTAVEILHAEHVNLSLAGKAGTLSLQNGISTCMHPIIQGFDQAVNAIDSIDLNTKDLPGLQLVHTGIISDLSRSLHLLQGITSTLDKAITPILSFQGTITNAILNSPLSVLFELASVGEVVGFAGLAACSLYSLTKSISKESQLTEQREDYAKRNAMVQMVMTQEDHLINQDIEEAIQAIENLDHIPGTKTSKEERNNIKNSYNNVKKSIKSCKNIDDYKKILEEIHNLEKQKTQFVSELHKKAKEIQNKIDQLANSPSPQQIPKEELEKDKKELKMYLENAKQLELIDLRLEAFKSKELYFYGLQLCLINYLVTEDDAVSTQTTTNLTEKGSKTSRAIKKFFTQFSQPEKPSAPINKTAKEMEKDKKIADLAKGIGLDNERKMLVKILQKNNISNEKIYEFFEMLDNPAKMEEARKAILMDQGGLSLEHYEALKKFRQNAPIPVREESEINAMRILSNKFKTATKESDYAKIDIGNRTFTSLYHLTNTSLWIVALAAGAASLNPATAAAMGALGLAAAGASATSSYLIRRLPKTNAEKARVEDTTVTLVNFLTNQIIDNNIDKSIMNPHEILLAKRSIMILAGVPEDVQESVLALVATTMDSVSSKDLKAGHSRYHLEAVQHETLTQSQQVLSHMVKV